MICLALTGKTIDENIEIISKYKKYIDLVELRADFLHPEEREKVSLLPGMIDKPAILTYRLPKDGGFFTEDESLRLELLSQGLEGGFEYVDLEEDLEAPELELQATEKGTTIIRSFHDFDKVPEDLIQRIQSMPRSDKEIPKAAVMPTSSADFHTLLTIFKALKGTKKILLGMGAYGFPTRILSNPLGSYLTYCSPENASAAPGHVDPVTLNELYRFKNITKGTAIYGIIGNPVMHTKSPVIHNKGFAGINLDAVYLPFQVDSIEDFMKSAEILNIQGLSVTIPHKVDIIPLLEKPLDKGVEAIGSCNTLIKSASSWKGVNTDAPGFMWPLYKTFSPEQLGSKKAAVIGAGGAARAIIFALQEAGMEVLVLNRTASKAKELAEYFNCAWAGLDDDGIAKLSDYNDIIVQTTSVGMHPMEDKNPIAGYEFTGSEIAYDIIYVPEETVFLKKAKEAGCPIFGGKVMLLAQGWDQFRLFTGKAHPQEGVV